MYIYFYENKIKKLTGLTIYTVVIYSMANRVNRTRLKRKTESMHIKKNKDEFN